MDRAPLRPRGSRVGPELTRRPRGLRLNALAGRVKYIYAVNRWLILGLRLPSTTTKDTCGRTEWSNSDFCRSCSHTPSRHGSQSRSRSSALPEENGLGAVDPTVTARVVGIDINPAYLEATRRRFGTILNLELHCLDLASQQVELEPVDLVHGGLILEHAGTERCLDNALAMVGRHGSLSVVLQMPSALEPQVGASPFPAISKLASDFSLVNPDALITQLATRSFEWVHQSTRPLPAGKAFWLGIFKRMVGTTLHSNSVSGTKLVDSSK